MDRSFLCAGSTAPGKYVRKRVEIGPPRDLDLCSSTEGRVDQGDRREGRAGTGVFVETAGDHPEKSSTVRRREQSRFASTDVLVLRRVPLVGARQVHPKLDPMEQATGDDE